MASIVTGALGKLGYAGLGSMFEYVNGDGSLTKWNCGQAAATTLLTHCGILTAKSPTDIRDIERQFPPDLLGGWLGSSRRRVTQICKAHGIDLREVRGEEGLRRELGMDRPVIVMLGVSAGKLLGYDLPGGHWMVAYGFDAESVYLTNWGAMSWAEFRAGWRAIVPRFIQMSERGLTEA